MMNEIIAVVTITILAVISPGADFAMVTRNSFMYGRKSGLMSALGISIGVQVHVMYTVFGIGLLISQSPSLFIAVKLIGACYLIYIGLSTIRKVMSGTEINNEVKASDNYESFKMGFLTNALNPKTMLFVLSVFTQFLSKDTDMITLYLYGLFMSLAHFIWFCFVAIFFSNDSLRAIMLEKQKYTNNTIGSILMILGFALLFSPMAGK